MLRLISINRLKKPSKYSGYINYHEHILSPYLIILFIWATLVVYSPHSFGQTEDPTEYRLKTAFLYNFVNFTEWPHIDKRETFNMCFFDGNPFSPYLDYITQKKVKDLQVTIFEKTDSTNLNECHFLYISSSAVNAKLERIIEIIGNKSILTIADSVGAFPKGVIIHMGVEAGKITFEVNLASARTAGLILSSQLLRFAKEVYQ